MAIFVLLVSLFITILGIEAKRCEFEYEKDNFYRCLRRHWNYGTEYIDKPTAYLRYIYVTEDICERGYIDRVNNCIDLNVSPTCGSIHRYWSGARKKAEYICTHYNEFKFEHRHCRTNHRLLKGYEYCATRNRRERRMEFCEKTEELRQCIGQTLGRHCSHKAANFFMNVLDTELSTEMKYRNCKKEEIYIGQPTTQPQPLDKTQTVLESFKNTKASSERLELNFETMWNGVQSPHTTYAYIAVYIFVLIFLR